MEDYRIRISVRFLPTWKNIKNLSIWHIYTWACLLSMQLWTLFSMQLWTLCRNWFWSECNSARCAIVPQRFGKTECFANVWPLSKVSSLLENAMGPLESLAQAWSNCWNFIMFSKQNDPNNIAQWQGTAVWVEMEISGCIVDLKFGNQTLLWSLKPKFFVYKTHSPWPSSQEAWDIVVCCMIMVWWMMKRIYNSGILDSRGV